MTSQIIYKGNLRTQATHLQSGNTLITDAPTDNHGMGEAFSPTDLLATSLGSCMLTIMGIKAADAGITLEGTTVEITKIMAANPRRVGEIHVVFNFPEGLTVDAKTQQILENAAHTCPVAKSLHPDLVTNVIFNW
ncbi:MAG: OsmC family peroxiredoxin [Bacteroidetes bacterium]|nr:MAG: OsmC family peroxiredoxin [Bacteroidota bacterium]